MEDILIRFIENMGDRVTGPMKLRLVMQPLMVAIFAVIGGLRDARTGKPPYFWSLVIDPVHRRDMLKDGWKSIGKVFVIAMALDVVYQLIELRFVYPGEVIIVAILLAVLPYLVLRGLVNRIARLFVAKPSGEVG